MVSPRITAFSLRSWLLMAVAVMASACAGTQLPAPTDADALRASRDWPGTTLASLSEGRTAYLDHCSACHAPFAPSAKPADQWPKLVNEMAVRSKLDRAQADAVIRYLVTAAQRPYPVAAR
jgi:cytochrome c5